MEEPSGASPSFISGTIRSTISPVPDHGRRSHKEPSAHAEKPNDGGPFRRTQSRLSSLPWLMAERLVNQVAPVLSPNEAFFGSISISISFGIGITNICGKYYSDTIASTEKRNKRRFRPRPNRIALRVFLSSFNYLYCYCTGDAEDDNNKLTLYSYWRSSCSFRVRIVLNLKGLKYEYKAVNLLKGEQSHPEFLKINPVGFVPVLVDGHVLLSDSFAIIMYLEDKYPQHPLLPHDILKRAINFQAANIVSSTIQPLQNLFILNYIGEKVGPDEQLPWVQSAIRRGFTALEKLLKDHTGRYATGDEVFLADVFLAPQLHVAFTKFNIHMNEFPILSRLHVTYNEIPAFQEALPSNQPDAVH